MKKSVILLFSILCCICPNWQLKGQTLNPEQNSGGGGFYQQGNFTLSLTFGEVTLDVLDTGNIMLTPGYQQPFAVPVTNVLNIPAGWSGISSYLIPFDSLVSVMFSPVVNDLTIILSGTGKVYWPGQGINTLIYWNSHQGYKIKMENTVQLECVGYPENDRIIHLKSGWSIIPVLAEEDVQTVPLFAPILSKLIIVKQIAGQGIYWPGQGINNMPFLNPGKAYQIAVNDSCSIAFPPPSQANIFPSPVNDPVNITPWNNVVKTDVSHIVAIDRSVLKTLRENDFLCAFNETGVCAGLMTVQQTQNNDALVVFGDDKTTSDMSEGMNTGDELVYRLFRPSTSEVYDVLVKYDPGLPNQGLFADNGLSKITGISLNLTEIKEPANNSWISVYPNPTKENIFIQVFRATGTYPVIELWNLKGQLLDKTLAVDKVTTLNMSQVNKGVYLIKVITDDASAIFKIVKE